MGPYWTFCMAVALSLLYWFMLANYVSIILHRSMAHRAFTLPRWWVLSITAITNLFFIYVNPRLWVAEHRLHHAHSDTDEDPDKRPDHTLLTWLPYLLFRSPSANEPHLVKVSRDEIFDSWVMRFFSSRVGQVTSEVCGWIIPLVCFETLLGAFCMWFGIRLGGIAVKMIQSYFAHSAKDGWGYRIYDLPDQTANIRHPAAVFITAGESLQNNHHAKPTLPIHAHRPDEWDSVFWWIEILDRLGLVTFPQGRRAPSYRPVAAPAVSVVTAK